MAMKVILCDQNEMLCAAWRSMFGGLESVEVRHGDIFACEAEAIVSPANSFGFMDGGIDAAYLDRFDRFGHDIQTRLQVEICVHGGELLVGEALPVKIIGLDNPEWMISAPTMRTPRVIIDRDAVRLSTRAALRCAIKLDVESILFPGMGAGSGRVPPEIVASEMRKGWSDVFAPQPFPSSWQEAAAR